MLHTGTSAQCINRFPYTEDFQNSNGGWKAGGTASDWAWGVPQKSVIFNAGNTNKCWIAGGLTGNFYNENEKSWLQSPCYDFSAIQNPYISFLLNWDTETGYDGAALQYSVDDGISWESAGAFGDKPTGCDNNHWFNSSFISYGMQAEGWSGSNSNGGSLGWVTAYHSFPQLSGRSNIMFRFVFGAGKIKNNFDGFAVDNVYIGETPPDTLSFAYTCLSTPKQASFATQENGCIVTSSLQWNFGDPASGTNNTANGNTTEHEFSAPGIYTITLSGKNKGNLTVTSTQTLIIPDVVINIITPILCNGSTTTIEANIKNTPAKASYIWSANPAANTSSLQAKAGSYQVTASVEGGCSNSAVISVPEPEALTHTLQTQPADCNNQNGTITLSESGGVPSYTYTWQGLPFTASSENQLPSGNYSITVTDQNSCIETIHLTLPAVPSTLTQNVTTGLPDCGISNGLIRLHTSGGNPGYIYSWTPDIGVDNEASNIPSGNYTVVTQDQSQCRDTVMISLLSKPFSVSLGNDTVVCKGQTLLLKPTGNYASYLWNDGTATPAKTVSEEGNYVVTVTNAGGCKASDTIHLSTGCGDLVFPSVFTPNGDGLNEQFGPGGGLSLVSSYRMLIYNRFGNLVFQSSNPYQKWKGDVNGVKLTGTYTFMATYTYEGKRKIKKGTLVLFL